MKKYVSTSVKWMALAGAITVLMFITGVILFIVDFDNISLSFGLAAGGFLFSLILLSCCFAEKSRSVIIDSDKLVLPRGAQINNKFSFKKTIINMNDVVSLESQLQKGDKIITLDFYFHTLTLKDGTKVMFHLYSYGKKAEKEILEVIRNYI